MLGDGQDLQGRIALVTGGGKGVGKVVARQLALRGAHVLVNCFHSYERARETVAELEALGARADVLRASVAKREQVDRMFDEITERFGHLDVLVNNAADGWLGPVAETTEDHFARALHTNLLGSFWCARRAAPLMAVRGGGCIVNVSSNGAGMVPGSYLAVGTSKAALEALTRHLAVELAPVGVRVNTASCSLIDGDVANLFPRAEEMKRVTARSTPLGRLATAEDLAGVVAFLTSDASRWVTGQVVLADGGLSLGHAMLSAPRDPEPQAATEPVEPAETAGSVEPSEPVEPAETAGSVEPGEPAGDPVVVVGMGMAAPGASSPEEYWDLAMRGAELFVDVPAERWAGDGFHDEDPSAEDKTYQTRSGFITGFTPEPGLAAEIERGEVTTDETTRWLRHALAQALRGVGRREGDRVTFCVGYTADGNQHLEEALVLSGASQRLETHGRSRDVDPAMLDAARDVLEARLWRGRAGGAAHLPHRVGGDAMRGLLPDGTELLMLDTACSSSLYAVDVGMKSLLLGERDVAVCGGSFALGPRGAVLFSKLHGLSRSGAVRSLDADADGVLFSDGAGVVVLKRLSRAVADGDSVLGVLAGVGTSSDGRGKAIYAPSSSGQAIAVARALAAPGVEVDQVDWVIAHATGTTAGDLAEMTTLRTSLGAAAPPGREIAVTSNKSLVGHTGWAAGVVSLIEVLLALRHETIPRQHRFRAAPAAFELEGSALRIPTAPVPWPRGGGRPRAAAVSGFGFGGTNAHLVVREHDGSGVAVPDMGTDEPLVVVGWSARVPGADRDDVQRWLAGTGAAPGSTFGDTYPPPPLTAVRIPPGTVRSIDRCQLMTLESVLPLKEQLGDFWDAARDTAGMFVGHLGATRNGTLYAHRCYLDELRRVLVQGTAGPWEQGLREAFEAYADEVRALVPPSNENSFPGIMPNVIPSRVSNYLDLHGVNMTVDTGLAASLGALDVAARYLRSGDLDLALVTGVNGNSTAESTRVARDLLGDEAAVVAEGAFTLALVRASTAREHGLEPLARLRVRSGGAETSDARATTDGRTYLGADGLLAVLRAVVRRESPALVAAPDCIGPLVEVTGVDGVLTSRPAEPAEPAEAAEPAEPADPAEPAKPAEPAPLTVHRHVAVTRPYPLERVRPPVPFVQPGTVVLTDDPGLLAGVPVPDGALALSTRAPATPVTNLVHVDEPTPERVAAALARMAGTPQHVRLLTAARDTGARGSTSATDPRGDLDLHDLLFLTLQQAYDGLTRPGATLAVCVLGGWERGAPHPDAGLWTGLVKSVAVELRSLLAFTVLTTTRDAAEGVEQVVAESTAGHFLPVVVHDGGVRCTTFLEPAEPAPPTGDPWLGESSVVLAAGGSRGIAAELLVDLARRYRPVIYLLGRGDALGSDEDLPPRADYVRELLARRAVTTVAAANRSYQERLDARTARLNLDRMATHCGPERVRYLRCDVLDPVAVRAAAATVLAETGRVDLLLNVAGINRAADIPSKRPADFRAVRDLKVLSHRNLSDALGDSVGTWCNFGSIVGFTGQAGETDYAAGNDYLTTAAQAAAAQGRRELTIGWCLWADAGLGADPVTRAFLRKSGIYTGMSTAEGVHHFVREITGDRRDPAVMLLGASERAALEDYRPGYLEAGRSGTAPSEAPEAPEAIGAMLDRRLSVGPTHAEYTRQFDLERDTYLAEHVVLGHPTLPGTFVTEIAAEAATDLVPGRVPAAFTELVLSSFLRVYESGRAVRKRVTARLVRHDDDVSVVHVRVLGDVVAPTGQVLVRDREHFRVDVVLRDELLPAPVWEPWSPHEDGEPVPDPYHVPNPGALLTGRLVSTRDTRRHALGRRATFDLAVPASDPVFSRFRVPALLLDGLLRVSVLDPVAGGHLVLAAPASIRRIELYTSANDLALAREHPVVDLYSCPARLDLEGPDVANRCVAATPQGRVLAQVHDTATAILGYVHAGSGRFLTREQMAALRAGA